MLVFSEKENGMVQNNGGSCLIYMEGEENAAEACEHSCRALQEKEQETRELTEIYESILEEDRKWQETAQQRIQELEREVLMLKGKLQVYEKRTQKEWESGEKNAEANVIVLRTGEQDLYEDEMQDVLLKLVEKEVRSMDQDPNLRESRKYHVLQSISRENRQSGNAEKIKRSLKEILKGGKDLNRKAKQQLHELGFQVAVGSHYKLTYKGDRRYILTLSATTSDHRSRENALTLASNQLFGY